MCEELIKLSNTPAEIIVHLQNVTVLQGETAIITTEISGNDIHAIAWIVNGTALNKLSPAMQSDMKLREETVGANERYTLMIRGKPVYDGISVQFLTVLSGGVQNLSDPVFMTVLGM